MPVTEPLKQPRGGWPALVREARKYLGTNPTARKKLWCATFMNLVLAKVGYAGTNSDAARSFAHYGHRISSPKIGAIAVLTRGKRGGHVGVVTGIDPHGNPIIISGNHGHRVGEGDLSRLARDRLRDADGKPAADASGRAFVAVRIVDAPTRNAERFVIDIDSPISELIAAIEAEQNRADTQPAAQPAPQPPLRRRGPSRRKPASGRSAGAATGRAAAASGRGAGAASGRTCRAAAPGRAADAAPHRAADGGPGVPGRRCQGCRRVRA